MRTLSIRQPWAWMILHAGKDVENRDWRTDFRGEFLIHAGKGCTRREYAEAIDFARAAGVGFNVRIPALEAMQRGGIVGVVDLVHCVTSSASPWFVGEFGFILQNARPLPFTPRTGRLGWFDVPRDEVSW